MCFPKSVSTAATRGSAEAPGHRDFRSALPSLLSTEPDGPELQNARHLLNLVYTCVCKASSFLPQNPFHSFSTLPVIHEVSLQNTKLKTDPYMFAG